MLDPLFIKLTYNDETKTRLVRAKENLKLSYGGPSKRQTSGKLPIDKDFNSMNLTKPYRTENFLIRPRTCFISSERFVRKIEYNLLDVFCTVSSVYTWGFIHETDWYIYIFNASV